MRKIKILYVHQNLEIGGAENLRYLVLKNINREKYHIDICCLEKKGIIGEKVEGLGFSVFSLDQKLNLYNPIIFLKLYKLIRKNKYDIVHSCLFYANYYARISAFCAGVRNIFTEEHGIYLWKKKYKIFIILDRVLARVTNKIITCSNTVRRHILLQERLSPGKIVTLYNFIDTQGIDFSLSKQELRKKFSFSEDEFILGIIGGFRLEKGHETLFHALEKLNFSNYKVLVVGDGPLRKSFHECVNKLGIRNKVLFMGKRKNVYEILRLLDLLVIPSEREGLPMILLEAMACSLPIVATKVSGIREVLRDKKTGLLVPKRDPVSLGKAISYIKDNPEFTRK